MTQEDEQIAQRRAHLAAIETLGLPAYPHRFNAADTISGLVDAYEPKTAEELTASRIETVTGSITNMKTSVAMNMSPATAIAGAT